MVPFSKYHALGNDYLVLDPKNKTPMYSSDETIRICHRNFGLGSDGILYGPLQSEVADFRLEIWNPDGSEAEKSGNGLRIFTFYLYDRQLVQPDVDFRVETLGGITTCRINASSNTATVQLGRISFSSEAIPVKGPKREVLNESMLVGGQSISFSSATIGNPHVVILHDHPTKELACKLGPLIENNTDMFPNRTNVQFMRILDRNNIQIEIWERGAGYTLASGSSSSAAASVAHKTGHCDEDITVHCPGGRVHIVLSPQFDVTMTAAVTRVGEFQLCSDVFTY